MKAATLNALFRAYHADPASQLDPLLIAVRRTALRVLLDEDAAQAFVVEIWQLLPDLKAKGSFSAFIRRRLYWRSVDRARHLERTADWMQPAPLRHDEDGELLSVEESLELVGFEWNRSTGQLTEAFEDERPQPDLSSIGDPVIRTAAELIHQGRTQAQVADALGLSHAALRMRLARYRKTLCASAA